MKETLLSNWNFTRWFRLILGVFFVIQALQSHDKLSGLLGAILMFQAATNTGCCCTSACSINFNKSKSTVVKEIEFEEIKKS